MNSILFLYFVSGEITIDGVELEKFPFIDVEILIKAFLFLDWFVELLFGEQRSRKLQKQSIKSSLYNCFGGEFLGVKIKKKVCLLFCFCQISNLLDDGRYLIHLIQYWQYIQLDNIYVYVRWIGDFCHRFIYPKNNLFLLI